MFLLIHYVYEYLYVHCARIPIHSTLLSLSAVFGPNGELEQNLGPAVRNLMVWIFEQVVKLRRMERDKRQAQVEADRKKCACKCVRARKQNMIRWFTQDVSVWNIDAQFRTYPISFF